MRRSGVNLKKTTIKQMSQSVVGDVPPMDKIEENKEEENDMDDMLNNFESNIRGTQVIQNNLYAKR